MYFGDFFEIWKEDESERIVCHRKIEDSMKHFQVTYVCPLRIEELCIRQL